MRILFAGTPSIAVPSLAALAESHDIAAVLTNPDRPQGRKKTLIPSPVKEKALELGLTVLQPLKLDESFLSEVAALKADLLVSVAFGQIFRQNFLDLFPQGALNLHPSRLPQFRGASPLNAAVAAGLEVSAVTIQKMALKMDSGDILIQEDMPLDPRETTGSLTEKAAVQGAPLLVKAVNLLEQGKAEPRKQNEEEASYCTLIKKSHGEINWSHSAVHIDRQIRSCTPWPGAYSHWKNQLLYIREAVPLKEQDLQLSGTPGRVLGVDKTQGILIETGDGVLIAKRLQLQSRKNLDYTSFLNGNRDFLNSQLGV